MNLSLKTTLRIGLGISLVFLLITSIASYISIRNLIGSADLVLKSNNIIADIDEILSTVKDAETGQRGYLLTKNREFLAPYNGSQGKTDVLFAAVMAKTVNNPDQQLKLKKLKVTVDERLAILATLIAGPAKSDADLQSTLLRGRSYMAQARNIVTELKISEAKYLANRTSEMNAIAGYTPFLIIFASLVSIFSTLFFYRKVSAEFSEKLVLNEQLQILNTETSRRIETMKNIAHQISNGNYKIRLQENAKDGLGVLSTSLNNMAESLKNSFNALEDKDWLQTGVATLNDKMVGEKDIVSLSGDILEVIVEHTKSAVGAFIY